jgi:hypothetical protein
LQTGSGSKFPLSWWVSPPDIASFVGLSLSKKIFINIQNKLPMSGVCADGFCGPLNEIIFTYLNFTLPKYIAALFDSKET